MSARRGALAFVLLLAAGTAARAQTPAAPAAAPADRGYAMATAESAFGNVTSQSFGAEIGVTVRPELQVFGSFGMVRDVATTELGTAASTIASALAQLQPSAVSYSVKEPATFFTGGVRYRFKVDSKLQPYVSAGLGIASVTKDVKFLIGGSDAAGSLAQYVTLGSDISGDETGLMFTFGGGVVYPVWQQVIVDLHYQFGRISTETPITVSRAGIGLGIRF